MECVGAGISGGGTPGDHETGGRAQVGWVRPPLSWHGACPSYSDFPKILKYSRKNHTKLAGHLENFYFWDIFYCMDNSENRQKILFLFYLI